MNLPKPEPRPGPMPKLILVEGPGSCGKTTFIERFLRYHGYQANFPLPDTGYLNTARKKIPDDMDEVEGAEWMGDAIEAAQGAPLIIDRYVLSAMVYAYCLGNQPMLDSKDITALVKRIRFWYGKDYATLMFLAEAGTIAGRMAQREDRIDWISSVDQVADCFAQLSDVSWTQTILINTTTMGPNQTYRHTMRALRERNSK